MICRRFLPVGALLMCALVSACGGDEPESARSAIAVTGPSAGAPASGVAYPSAALDPAGVIAFPPRNESFAFRNELEVKYRDGLRRAASSTFVDVEGDIVWTQEYVRYRVNQCDHATAVQKVLDQIDGRGIAPVCGDPPSGGPVLFPPRNEPYAFRQALETKYRDGLRRGATSSFVDIEGAIVWTQEYLRYRVNRCGHAAAAQKVMDQIDGKGIAPVCVEGPAGVWAGESDYFNAPFMMDISLRGTSLGGRYTDQYDSGTLWGTYEGGPVIVINAYFGDGGIRFEGEFDGPDKVKGTMRVSTIGRLFTFSMTRRP